MFLGLETLPSVFSTYCLIRARLAGNKEPVNGQGLANIVVFKIISLMARSMLKNYFLHASF